MEKSFCFLVTTENSNDEAYRDNVVDVVCYASANDAFNEFMNRVQEGLVRRMVASDSLKLSWRNSEADFDHQGDVFFPKVKPLDEYALDDADDSLMGFVLLSNGIPAKYLMLEMSECSTWNITELRRKCISLNQNEPLKPLTLKLQKGIDPRTKDGVKYLCREHGDIEPKWSITPCRYSAVEFIRDLYSTEGNPWDAAIMLNNDDIEIDWDGLRKVLLLLNEISFTVLWSEHDFCTYRFAQTDVV